MGNESWLITRTPYLIGTIMFGGFLAFVCGIFQKHGAYPVVLMAPMPLWALIMLALGIGPIGMAFPSGMTLPRFLIFPTLYMTWPMGLAALVIYGMVAYPAFEIPVWVMIP